MKLKTKAKLAGVVVVAAAAAKGGAVKPITAAAGLTSVPGPSSAGQRAISYAEHQVELGTPYVWGGTTSGRALDCSGLAWEAYGEKIPRTTYDQWRYLPHVPASQVQDGDLVLFAGSDGTASDPGHVGLVVDARKHLMVQEYGTGYVAMYSTYGGASSLPGTQSIVGFVNPSAAGSNT